MQDWVVKPQLRKVPRRGRGEHLGRVREAIPRGGGADRLIKYRLTFEELVEALEANNQNVGGGQIVRGGESLLVHGVGLTTNVAGNRQHRHHRRMTARRCACATWRR